MARNTSISLGDHFADFVDQQVKGGRYGSASDVVRAGLRILEERETRLETLRSALIDGEQSGVAEPFDIEDFLTTKAKQFR
ncbi:antitoxin [Komagataeibacter xylinus]|nr:putative addiction module antidote protein, CopG/Arc/MetJ family [Komagataeibacter xylinus E25]RFP05653.1 antitoxin [Komagataeibacter xylinus]RFP07725.1 antitoxin [Komagataeibacter xylinus]